MTLVGNSVERVGVRAEVSRELRYTADLTFPGQLYAKALRPFGAKGMGEAALPPTAPAIGNAIANALNGTRVRDLPIKPEKVFSVIDAAKTKL